MENTIEKLNQNRLLELTNAEYEHIKNNAELLSLFLLKIREGHPFYVRDAGEVLQEYLFDPIYMSIIFERYKIEGPEEFYELICMSNEELSEELTPEQAKVILDYKQENYEILEKEVGELRIQLDKIADERIIKYIIDNRLEFHYGSILMNPLTPEFEELLIDALDRNTYKTINSISEKILKKCMETKQLEALSGSIDTDNPEMMEEIIEGLKNNEIQVSKLAYSLQQKLSHRPEYMRAVIIQNSIRHYHFEEEILAIKEIRDVIIECLPNYPSLAQDWTLKHNAKEHPDLAIELLKYYNENQLREIGTYYSEELVLLLNYDKTLAIKNLLIALERNLDNLDYIFSNWLTKHYSGAQVIYSLFQYKEFTDYVLKRLSLEKVLELTTTRTYDYETGTYKFVIPEEIYEALENTQVHLSKVPENFAFKSTLPENVWIEIIRVIDEERLIPENINLELFHKSEAILEALLIRLADLRSNKFNSVLEKYENNLNLNDKCFEIINRKDNPLNLNATQKIKLLPLILKSKPENIIKIIDNTDELTATNVVSIFRIALEFDEVKETNKLLSHLFNSNKIIMDENTIQSLTSFSADFVYLYYEAINNPETQSANPIAIAFVEQLRNFLLKQGPLPLDLTSLYDKEVREKTTYSDPSLLSTNPKLFLTNRTVDRDYLDFIKDCIKKNLPINLKVIHHAFTNAEKLNEQKRSNADTVDAERLQAINLEPDINSISFYEHKNIIFDKDLETYKIITKLFESISEPEIRPIIDNWVANELDYNVFDTQMHYYNKDLIEKLIRHENYIPSVINAIKPEKVKDNIVISNYVLELLFADINEQTNKEIKETIYTLIDHNKINKFDFNQLTTYTNYLIITDQRFINYIKKSINSISDILNQLSLFLSSDIYKEFTLNLLQKNPEYGTNETIVRLSEKFPELNPYILDSLENNTNYWLTFNAKYLEKEFLLAYLKNHKIAGAITFLVHNPTSHKFLSKESSQIIKEQFLQDNPEYNKEAYETFEAHFETELPTLLENDKILNLLKKDKKTVERFIAIIKPRKLDESIITSINDSFRQNYFGIIYDDIINFYTNTLEKIQRGITPEETTEVMMELNGYIPDDLEDVIKETGNELLLQLYKTNKNDFLGVLLQELSNNQNIYAPVFNKITNHLITQKRNEFRSEQDIYVDTKLKYQLEKRSLYNALFNYLSKKRPRALLEALRPQDKLDDLNEQTIYFLAGVEDKYDKSNLPKIKRNIPELKKIIFEYFDYLNEEDKKKKETLNYNWWLFDDRPQKKQDYMPMKFQNLLLMEDFMKGIKKIPIYPTRKSNQELLSNINIDSILTYINDDNKFKALISILDKYRFLEWNDLFSPTVKHLSLGEEDINIFNFINAFNSVYENEKRMILQARKRLMQTVIEDMKNNGKTQEEINEYIALKEKEPLNIQITAFKILKYCTIYSSIANYYKIILGLEDFEIIKRNDPPYTGYGTQEERLELTSQLAIQSMEFDQVTVPSFIHEHTTKENKKLQITIGNRADTRNLCHGERTKACMRAKGHAHSLFMFSNTDPRGFHIVFTDPETNEYVSRITGFRNGNTVFLNQLRHSCSLNYTDQDVIDAMYETAQELIERSKDSDMPIENVVASPSYALAGYPTQQLSEYNIGAGVYDGYKDVTDNAVVLATTGKDGKAVDLKLDGENQPIYQSVRLKPREYQTTQINTTIKVLMQRINALKECLENKENPEYYKTIDFDYEFDEKEFIHAIIGQDWYVALDTSGNIIHNIAIQNTHSIEELNEALAKINEIKEAKQKIGGFSNGI